MLRPLPPCSLCSDPLHMFSFPAAICRRDGRPGRCGRRKAVYPASPLTGRARAGAAPSTVSLLGTVLRATGKILLELPTSTALHKQYCSHLNMQYHTQSACPIGTAGCILELTPRVANNHIGQRWGVQPLQWLMEKRFHSTWCTISALRPTVPQLHVHLNGVPSLAGRHGISTQRGAGDVALNRESQALGMAINLQKAQLKFHSSHLTPLPIIPENILAVLGVSGRGRERVDCILINNG